MKIKTAKKINKNPNRYHPHQISKANTILARAERKKQKKLNAETTQ